MTERPIIFHGDLVRAILRGEKTQTRRPVKPQPVFLPDAVPPRWRWKSRRFIAEWVDKAGGLGMQDFCPFGQPYDRLWGRETFALGEPPYFGVAYRADEGDNPEDVGGRRQKWTPSIHMPRYLSRITLEIIDVRVERVQDINESEAQAEGVRPAFSHPGLDGVVSQPSYRWGFWRLWDKLYAERGLGWDVNPWVWAITFRRVESSHEN